MIVIRSVKAPIQFSLTALLRGHNPRILLFSYLKSKTSAACAFTWLVLVCGSFDYNMARHLYILLVNVAFLLFCTDIGQTGMSFFNIEFMS